MNTISSVYLKNVKIYKDKPLFWYKNNSEWNSITWNKSRDILLKVIHGLDLIGIKKNDKLSIIDENSYKWCISDLAVNMLGAITVPGYTTSNEEELKHLILHSDTSVIFTNFVICSKILTFIKKIKKIKFIILLDNSNKELFVCKSFKILTFDELIEMGSKSNLNKTIENYVDDIKADDLACIIYTSGTSNLPKGVMLSHNSIISNINGAKELLKDIKVKNHRFLSILPLSHAYEHTAGFLLPLCIGGEIYFNENRDHLTNDLLTVNPTLMIAVPRLYEVLHKRIISQISVQNKISQKLFFKALDLGIKKFNNNLNFIEKIIDLFLTFSVRKKIKYRFGGKLETFISGGAALNEHVGLFFNALGIKILQGYGQTECGPIISTNPITNIKLKTVGPPIKGLEVKLSIENEILVKGNSVMKGYWKNQKATDNTIINNWLHTGDIGFIDKDNYIQITGRKNEMIVNSGGENISPVPIENLLMSSKEIDQVLIYGQNRPFLIAIIVPSDLPLKGTNNEKVILRKLLKDVINETNTMLSQKNKVRKFLIADDGFNFANGQMTPTLKLKRQKITDFYYKEIEKLY